MDLSPIAAEYIRNHRADCSDAEIRKALKQQGFSDAVLNDAFHEAGDRPASAATPAQKNPSLRILVWALWAISVLLFVGAIALAVHKAENAISTQAQPSTQAP
ncbi:MAG: hypothetical protein ACHQ51_11510 [Elusimicrobiota bacterium]